MTSMLRKAAISAVAALTLGAGVTTTATPSMAQGWQGHGWHGGGWRGGYWRGGRWYGGGWGTGRSGRPRRPRARRARRIGLCLRSRLLRPLLLAEPASLRRLGQFCRLPARPSLLLILGRWRQSPAKKAGFNFFSISI